MKSRDDIPAILIGLQDPFSDEGTRKRLSGLPGWLVLPGKNRRVGGPGMEPLTILVLGVVAGSRVRFPPASGTGEPAHPDPAKVGGRATDHGTWTDTDTGGWLTACRSPRRSFPPRSEGWSWRGATGWPEKKPGAASRGRRHSFVAGTDVHHPTDRSLPMDAARCMVRDVSRACGGPGPLRLALKLADRAEASCAEIDGRLGIPGPSDSIRGFIGHVRHRSDLIGRRILKGGTIPHRGKVHPISGPHTRWISKGKAGVPVEPGVSVRVPEDRHRFILHRSVMWEGSDVDVAVPMGGSAINSLEHRGLDRVRSHGKEGFAGAVALAVLAANVHRPGLMPPARERPVLPAA